MKKTMKSLVLALSFAFVAASAQADSSSYVVGGVGAGTSVFFGSGAANGTFNADAATNSFNGGTQVQIAGGTNNGVIGVYGNTNGGAQAVSVANQTGNSANVDSAAVVNANSNVFFGAASVNSGAYAAGSAWH